MNEIKPVNVQCEKCRCYGYIEWFDETPTGYVCKDCDHKPTINMQIRIKQKND